MSSQSTDDTLRHDLDTLHKQTQHLLCETQQLARRKLPVQKQLTTVTAPLEWDPRTGPDTAFQRDLLWWYNQFGIRGIQSFLVEWADDMYMKTSQKQFEQLKDEIGPLIPSYLASLPPALIQAVICNNIPSRMKDPEFKKHVEDWVRCEHKLGPGVYEISVAHKETGLGPTLRQLVDISNTMSRYIDLEDTAFISTARTIDNQYPQKWGIRDDYTVKRRYSRVLKNGTHDFKAIRNWLEILEQEYLHLTKSLPQDHPYWDTGMSRLFTYIGWAKNLDERSHKHTTHYGLESIVFGLFSAVVKYLFGLEFQITRTVLFYATSGVHAGITEILGHAMASGYLELGGFNHSWAGGRGSGAGLDTEEVTQQVDLHKEMILKSGHVEENLMQNDEKLERLTFACDEDAQEQLWSETAEAQTKCLQRAEESEKSVEKTHTSVLLADFQVKLELAAHKNRMTADEDAS
ncbi:hypothetical protein ABEF95_002203 [Exophiala dermatitidis]